MVKIALYGKEYGELEYVKADIQAFAPILKQIEMTTDFTILQNLFFKINMLLIEECLFYHTLPKIREVMDISDPQKTAGQKIIITNFTTPITKKQTDVWLDSLGYCDDVKIPIMNGFRVERLHDILYFENRERKVYVKTFDDFYKSSLSLKDVSELTHGTLFASPYVSFWVNLRHVEAIKGRDVFLKNGDTLPLSQKKAASFRKLYGETMSKM